MSKFSISNKDRDYLTEQVKKAEKRTSAEIVLAVVRESDDYARFELLFAILFGLAYFLVLSMLFHPVESWLIKMSWDYAPLQAVMFYGFTTFFMIALAYFAANIAPVDRLIVPASTRARKVNERALRYFLESGAHNTRDRNGLLIFISLLERRIEIIADTGITRVIPADAWTRILQETSLKTQPFSGQLGKMIAKCADLLAEKFPPEDGDRNELPDGIEVLNK